MKPRRLVMFVTSGTGNTLRVAHWIAGRAEAGGMEATVHAMEGPAPVIEGGEADLIGLAAPAHGFNAPWHAMKFAARMPRRPGTPAFVFATRGRIKLGPVYVPGLSASCTFVLALLLTLRGYRVRGTDAFDMPSNWYSLHPIQRPATLHNIIARARGRAEAMADRLLAGQHAWRFNHLLYEGIGALLTFPISLGYLFMGRIFLAKLFFASHDCDGCGLCAKSCPVGAIAMWGQRSPRPFWRYSCESCMRCAAVCPHKAVEAGHSWLVLLYFICTVPVVAWLFATLGHLAPGLAALHDGWAGEVLSWLYWYPAMFLSYYLFHLANRWRPVNWLFAHTTATHFWGRYLEPDTRKKELMPPRRHGPLPAKK